MGSRLAQGPQAASPRSPSLGRLWERPDRLQLLLRRVFPIAAKHFFLQLGSTELFPPLAGGMEVNHLLAINL